MLCYLVLQLVVPVLSSIPNWSDITIIWIHFVLISVCSPTPPEYKDLCPVSPREQVDLKVFLHYGTCHNVPEQEESLS